MKDLNKAMIIGNLTRDPETRLTTSGQSVSSFAVATNRQWKDQSGETQTNAEFHDVVAWGKLAEIVEQYLKKGMRVYIEGRLQTRSWEGQDGVKRNKTEIVASDVIMLDRKSDNVSDTRVTSKQEIPEEKKEGNQSKDNQTKDGKEDKKDSSSDEIEEVDLDDIPF